MEAAAFIQAAGKRDGALRSGSSGSNDRGSDGSVGGKRPLMSSRTFRVLHVGKFYPPHRGGMESHLELLCEDLNGHCDVRVIVSNSRPFTTSERVRNIRVTRVATFGQIASTAVSPGMVQAIRAHPADIIHLHWPNPTAVVAYIRSRHPGRLVITYHSDVVRQKTLAKRIGVEDRVVFLGEVHDVVPYYHAADAFVLPSITRNEAFGIVQIEAMACGKPVINTSLDSAVPFVSVGGKTGITVAPQNVQELASAMNLLLENEHLRSQYGRAARRWVEAQFTANVMTQRTLALYNEILCSMEGVRTVDSRVNELQESEAIVLD